MKNSLPNAEETKKLYPKMVSAGLMGTEELVGKIAAGTTFSYGDLKGMLAALSGSIAKEVADGRTVKVDGLGVFSAKLGLVPDAVEENKDGHKRNAASIALTGIFFRVDRKLVELAANVFKPERSQKKFQYSSTEFTLEQRRDKAVYFLENHPFMSLADYMELTGLRRTTAWREMDAWLDEENCPVCLYGKGTHAQFVKR